MASKDENCTIFISAHKPAAFPSDSVFHPIILGADKNSKNFSSAEQQSLLKDNLGDNISDKNPEYCELTAQYWAWKNCEADYYGFFHYRRYLSFSNKTFPEDIYGNIVESYPSNSAFKRYKLNAETISALVKEYDIIAPIPHDLYHLDLPTYSVRDHYTKARYLHPEDFDLMMEIIKEKSPEYYPSAEKFASGHYACFCNMFIMRRDLFNRYCSWLFPLLDEFCLRRNMTNYSTEALRTPGHLAERLFNIFLLKEKKDNPRLRVKELQTVYFSNTTPSAPLAPAFPEHKNSTIPLVFAADNNFAHVFSVCLRSVLSNLNKDSFYDAVLIESDLTPENQALLLEMTEPYKNFSLRFYDPTSLISNHTLKANAHISKETYYRFLIQDIFPDYDKVLYLDCDLIVNSDITPLFSTDISDYMLAATRDPDFLGQINGANKKTQEYVKSDFKMQDPYNYFQAGVLLFNEQKMREKHSVEEWLALCQKPYLYNDQDILNLECENEVKYLDMSWNLIFDHTGSRYKDVISFAPDQIQKEYLNARKSPKIIHFAGYEKPWYNPSADFAPVFWRYAKETPFYEQLLAEIPNFRLKNFKKNFTASGISSRAKASTKHAVGEVYKTVAPLGSARWKALRRLRGKPTH